MLSLIEQLCSDEDGATAVEYALAAVAVTAVIIAVVFALGSRVSAIFTDVDIKLAAQ